MAIPTFREKAGYLNIIPHALTESSHIWMAISPKSLYAFLKQVFDKPLPSYLLLKQIETKEKTKQNCPYLHSHIRSLQNSKWPLETPEWLFTSLLHNTHIPVSISMFEHIRRKVEFCTQNNRIKLFIPCVQSHHHHISVPDNNTLQKIQALDYWWMAHHHHSNVCGKQKASHKQSTL